MFRQTKVAAARFPNPNQKVGINFDFGVPVPAKAKKAMLNRCIQLWRQHLLLLPRQLLECFQSDTQCTPVRFQIIEIPLRYGKVFFDLG